MPVDSLIVSAVIMGVFVIFGSILYWGERRTRTMPAAGEVEKFKRRSF